MRPSPQRPAAHRETLGTAALFFPPTDVEALARLSRVLDARRVAAERRRATRARGGLRPHLGRRRRRAAGVDPRGGPTTMSRLAMAGPSSLFLHGHDLLSALPLRRRGDVHLPPLERAGARAGIGSRSSTASMRSRRLAKAPPRGRSQHENVTVHRLKSRMAGSRRSSRICPAGPGLQAASCESGSSRASGSTSSTSTTSRSSAAPVCSS